MIWGLQWRSVNRLDGVSEHLIRENCLPVMFRTRQAARDYATERFQHIVERPDLRKEPHGWRKPKPVKLKVARLS